jgi:hypothetical protein
MDHHYHTRPPPPPQCAGREPFPLKTFFRVFLGCTLPNFLVEGRGRVELVGALP